MFSLMCFQYVVELKGDTGPGYGTQNIHMYTTIWGIVKSYALGTMRSGELLNGIHNSSLRRASQGKCDFFLG